MSKTAVMFGAGAVGRGFLGQLFSESGYKVIFIDVDATLIARLNARRAYPIHLVSNAGTQEVLVSPVCALDSRQNEEVSRAVAEASIAATAVGARILPVIAPLIAAGIQRRAANTDSPALNIIICENLKDAAASFRKMVAEHLPASAQDYLTHQIGFVDTVIGRMVPPPTEEMRALDPSLIAVEPYKELPVERAAFIGPIPEIVGMQPCDNFPAYTARKLYIHNCGHAYLGYLGYLKGYKYGYQALADAGIRADFEEAMHESITGIVAAYGVQAAWLEKHKADLTERFANRALGDTIFRIGRDPLRKLAPRDRLVGAAHLAEKAGVKPHALAKGIAAGYRFDSPEDALAVELQTIIRERGISTALETVSELKPGESLTNLVLEQYHPLTKKQ
jgi:mannitol-1-phosphate 5-dehydrogenase